MLTPVTELSSKADVPVRRPRSHDLGRAVEDLTAQIQEVRNQHHLTRAFLGGLLVGGAFIVYRWYLSTFQSK